MWQYFISLDIFDKVQKVGVALTPTGSNLKTLFLHTVRFYMGRPPLRPHGCFIDILAHMVAESNSLKQVIQA